MHNINIQTREKNMDEHQRKINGTMNIIIMYVNREDPVESYLADKHHHDGYFEMLVTTLQDSIPEDIWYGLKLNEVSYNCNTLPMPDKDQEVPLHMYFSDTWDDSSIYSTMTFFLDSAKSYYGIGPYSWNTSAYSDLNAIMPNPENELSEMAIEFCSKWNDTLNENIGKLCFLYIDKDQEEDSSYIVSIGLEDGLVDHESFNREELIAIMATIGYDNFENQDGEKIIKK